MVENRFLKRLSKKARKGLRGWPIATIAFYGPNLSQATKVAVGIVPSEDAAVEELRDWKVDHGDIRADPGIAREILEFLEKHQVRSVAMSGGVIGCPHQEGIDYEGEWCPVCEFWHGRDRFTGQRVPKGPQVSEILSVDSSTALKEPPRRARPERPMYPPTGP